MTGPQDLQPSKPLPSPGPSNYGAGADRKVDPRAVISPRVSGARLAEGERRCPRMLQGPWSLQGLQLPGRRVSTGPVFIIQRGLYFDLGARLIIAYNAQGETRHHLTVAADSLPAGCDAIWALGRERRGSCPCPGVLGTNMFTQAPPQPAGPGFSCSEVGLTTRDQLSISLPPRSPPATQGQ